ncbi:MAG: hypothetical protein IJO33_04265 [Bacilli bacterium]|nr:hypothetical protein [Bacilli bacterium]
MTERLRDLKIEDHIWLIYIGIIVLSWIANSLERRYFVFNDLNSKEKYRNLMIFIFSILVIVYLYFFNDSYKDLKKLKPFDSENKKNLTFLSFLGSLFVTLSGFIFLYIIIKDEQIDVEIAFN